MKVIFHLGYPKTATTTLQKLLFEKLDERKFNFIGRSGKAGREIEITRYLLGHRGNESLEKIATLFDPDRTNVYSEEGITNGCDLRSKNKTRDMFFLRNRLLFLVRALEDFYKKDVHTTIILTLRNQADLIESLYFELYDSCFRFLFPTPDYLINNLDHPYFCWFDFSRVINVFSLKNSEIKIYMFEELHHCDLFELFEADNSIMKYRYNVRLEKKVIRSISAANVLFSFVNFLPIEKLPYPCYAAGKKLFFALNKIRLRKKEELRFSEKHKAAIKQHFSLLNRKLKEYLPLEKLKEHGYLDGIDIY